MKKYICLLLLISILACERDDVNPAAYADDQDIRANEFVLNEETRILSAADKEEILGINQIGILVRPDAPFLDSIAVGSILVNTASDPGDSIAYYRKVTEIFALGNNIALRTEEAMLHEAFSRYIIDTRSNQFIFSRTNYFPIVVECKPEALMGWIGLTVGTNPDITGNISFDADSTYFTAQYDSGGAFPFKMNMRLKDLRFDLSGTVTFKGEIAIGGDIPLTGEPLPVLVVAQTGLTIYVLPKMDCKLKVGGEIISPEITITSGPHNFSFSYDQSKSNPISYTINPRIVPQIKQTADWSATGSGTAEIQVGTDVFLGLTGVPDLAKAGFFVFGYTGAVASRKGNFTDLQPRVSFDADAGIGAKVFAELSFLADDESYDPNDEWYNFTGKMESPDFKFPITKWHLNSIETCTMYNSVDMYTDNFQNSNELTLDVNCPGCTGSGFLVWVNDVPIDNGYSFPYNQSAIITLPPGLELLNTIAIQDDGSFGCYLQDNFLNPELFNSNCTQFTDARDGNTYCSVQIGNQIWMGENLRYSASGSKGHWYLNQPSPDTLLFGRLYTFTEVLDGAEANLGSDDNQIRGICPQGWHLPTRDEWDALSDAIGSPSTSGRSAKLPSSAVWPGADLPASSMFNAVSAGEYYPWFENRNGPVSGNRYRNTKFWTSNRIQHYNGSTPPMIVEIDEGNYFNIGAATIGGGFGSIEQIGYSCRCVKN